MRQLRAHSRCPTFDKGALPVTNCEDVTGGYAESFARRIGRTLQGVQSWRKAIERTVTLARKVRGTQRLSLPSGSVDLVTSSMVVSQFEHEPYQFSSRCWRRSALLGRVRSERSSPMMITHSGCCAYTRMRWSREVGRSLSSGRGARPGSGLSGTRTDAATNLRPHAKRRRPPVTLPPTPNFRSMPRCAGLSRYPCVTQIVTESLPPKTG